MPYIIDNVVNHLWTTLVFNMGTSRLLNDNPMVLLQKIYEAVDNMSG